jgi:hypothetical protein
MNIIPRQCYSKDQLETILNTVRTYVILCRILKSRYYFNQARKTIKLLDNQYNNDTVTLKLVA